VTSRASLLAFLLLLGAGWGATQTLSKIAVSTGHQPLGLIFWQLVIGVVLLGAIQVVRGRRLSLHRRALGLYLVIAMVGTLLPNSASYAAAVHLPAGILSITIALVPMMAFPLALLLRVDRFGWGRLAGLGLGLTGVALIAAPEASLPEPAMVAWLPLALVAPFFYAVEGNYVAKWGTAGCGAIEVLLGASTLGAVIVLPLAIASGQWIDPRAGIGAPEAALIASSAIHALAYTGYVWVIGRAGAVFAAQVAYLVTGTGVLWAMALLGESYSGWVWLALAAMLAGLFLVQPRPRDAIAATAPFREDAV
jgi:drug/metabolite transporter (DMT)-like permease